MREWLGGRSMRHFIGAQIHRVAVTCAKQRISVAHGSVKCVDSRCPHPPVFHLSGNVRDKRVSTQEVTSIASPEILERRASAQDIRVCKVECLLLGASHIRSLGDWSTPGTKNPGKRERENWSCIIGAHPYCPQPWRSPVFSSLQRWRFAAVRSGVGTVASPVAETA